MSKNKTISTSPFEVKQVEVVDATGRVARHDFPMICPKQSKTKSSLCPLRTLLYTKYIHIHT